MEKEIIFGILGAILAYILYRYYTKHIHAQQNSVEETYSDILNNDEYKVKGQHDYLKEL